MLRCGGGIVDWVTDSDSDCHESDWVFEYDGRVPHTKHILELCVSHYLLDLSTSKVDHQKKRDPFPVTRHYVSPPRDYHRDSLPSSPGTRGGEKSWKKSKRVLKRNSKVDTLSTIGYISLSSLFYPLSFLRLLLSLLHVTSVYTSLDPPCLQIHERSRNLQYWSKKLK